MEPLSRRDVLRWGAGIGVSAGLGLGSLPAAAQPGEGAGKPLRVGQIGVGGRGSGLLGDVLGIEGVQVAAICDLNEGARERAMDRVEKACGSRPDGYGDGPYDYRRLLQRKDIDCIVIATPCYWHEKMYVDCLNAGKPFYGEKPLAITAIGVKAIQEARAQRPDVVVQIGFQWGAHEARKDIFRKIQEGAIGEVLQGRFQRLNGWDGHGGWYADRNLSGDWMLEQAVHEFNLVWSALKMHPVKAYAAGGSGVIPGRNTTNYYTAVLQYPGRLVVHYTHGWIEVPDFPNGGFRAEFVGAKGAANIMDTYIQLRQAPPGGKARIEGKGPGGDTKEHFQNFFQCVRAKSPEKANCGIDNGVGASIIGLMIRKSIDEKREVTFEETMKDDRRPPLPPEPS